MVISSFLMSQNKYNMSPTYQRGRVWGTERKQALIDTILRGYDMPKFYIEKLGNPGAKEFNVVDGQQRLSTIVEFHKGFFRIGELSEDLFEGKLVGKYYKDLSANHQDIFNSFQLDMLHIFGAEESEIRDLFQRLQEGMPLTPPEKRNSMLGNMADFIREIANTHSVFPRIRMSDKRMQKHDLCAIAMCLELNDGKSDVAAKDLKKMYENEKTFNENGNVARKFKRLLDFIENILKFQDIPEMDIKWGFVDLYWALSKLEGKFKITGHEEGFGNFYTSFEQERRSIDDPLALTKSGNDWDEDLYKYLDPFQREGAKKNNIALRNEIYLRRIHRDIPTLQLLDPRRNFSRDERITIWRRDGKTCQECGEKIEFQDMEADHEFAWSLGGTTELANAQCLCSKCNKLKSNN